MTVQPMPLAPASYDLDNAAVACGLSRRELQEAIREGSLVARYRGTKPLIRPADLADFIDGLPTTRTA